MTNHIPPQQELEERMLSLLSEYHINRADITIGEAESKAQVDIASLKTQTRTDTIREVEERLAKSQPSTQRGWFLGYEAARQDLKCLNNIDLVTARIETAEQILHKGFVIPDMEVQLEDKINRLKGELKQLKGQK